MTETKNKIIAGIEFPISQPYAAGHQLTDVEARVLNQVRAENIANNMRKIVREKGEAAAEEVAAYDASYTFTVPSTGTRRTVDPVEREARAIARDAIRTRLAEDNRRLKDIDPAKLNAAIDTLIETNEEIIKIARKRVADKAKAAETSLGDLNL